jgi:pimeloyl-ACP methyl ester carboxylesterase
VTTTSPATTAAATVLTRRRVSGGTGHRVLLLHGLANSDSVWQPMLERWSRDDEVWSANLPWRVSSPTSWSRAGDPVRDLGETLRRVPGGAEVVIAHSYAANLLLEFLAQPESGTEPVLRPRRVVLVSPFFRPTPAAFTWADFQHFPARFRRIAEAGVEMHARGRLGPAARAQMADRVCELVGPYGWARFMEIYLRTPWLRTDLVAMPTLVVAGTDDFSPPSSESAALAAALPDARLRLIAGTGHFSMVEHPETFVAAVGDFLDGALRPAGTVP